MTPLLAAFILALGLVASTALLGFMALSGAWYLTHRVARPQGAHKGNGILDTIIPPPVAPEPAEIVLHPELEDYIRGESEGWYREELRRRAKDLYSQQADWPWVLVKLRELNEANSLPEV